MVKRLLVVVGIAAAVFVVGFRTKNPFVLSGLRRLNRMYFNPMQMDDAGTPGAYASIVHHVGRTSGDQYETPVVAIPAGDGFVIALPYADQADWSKNVLASGRATIVHEGDTIDLTDAETVTMDAVEHFFPEGDRRSHRLLGVDTALRLRGATAGTT